MPVGVMVGRLYGMGRAAATVRGRELLPGAEASGEDSTFFKLVER